MRAIAIQVFFVLWALSCNELQRKDQPNPDSSADLAAECSKPADFPAGTAIASNVYSYVSAAPVGMDDINTDAIREHWGTPLDPGMVTYGEKNGYRPDLPSYKTKTGTDINFDFRGQPVLAPLDARLIGFTNRSARQRTQNGVIKVPFDDLEICFESLDPAWPDLVLCFYHLLSSPLLREHSLTSTSCGQTNEWGEREQRHGRIYYETNDAYVCDFDARLSCGALMDRRVARGQVVGYAGEVAGSVFAPLRVKIRINQQSALVIKGDIYRHWVQASTFFYWKCYTEGASFPDGVLAFPYDCGASLSASREEYLPDYKYPP